MKRCWICNESAEVFMPFGKMPIANGFLSPDQFPEEYFFELQAAFCPKCTMVQLTEMVDRERMFHDNYAFFSSTSMRMASHFEAFARKVMDGFIQTPDPFIVEIGSNDGIMLQHFAQAGIRHLGIEPSANVAQAAVKKGVNTVCKFFDEETAREIIAQYGQADAFLGANVMCHIPYLHSVAEGIRLLLKPTGRLIFEDPYLGDIIEKTSYDQIYDEHAFYFSVTSLSHLFSQHGLEIVDTIPQPVHGGSMRYVVAPEGRQRPSDALIAQREKEDRLGLGRIETFHRFRKKVEQSRFRLISLLRELKEGGKRVVGYAATSKSTTVINYCGLTPDLVEFISDTTPLKQGKFSPGGHIPIRPYEDFAAPYPDYALLFGWNHAEEIMAKEKDFMKAGGQWIVYVPEVGIVS